MEDKELLEQVREIVKAASAAFGELNDWYRKCNEGGSGSRGYGRLRENFHNENLRHQCDNRARDISSKAYGKIAELFKGEGE